MKVLILSPHTDDGELGCGGSIAKLLEEGNELLWVVFSVAEESLPESSPKDTLKREFLKVTEHLGLEERNYEIHNFKVRHLQEHRQEVLEEIVKLRRNFRPDMVMIPSLNDYHQDHQVVANEAVRAFKMDASIVGYELPWNHITFDTTMFIRLEKRHIEKKCDLLKYYESQFRKERNYFSMEYVFGLARVRGTQCNTAYAEAFEVIRWMI
ncbi:MAG: PIG-L family deacetylase [Methanotrichaceae archaeon]|jgi:LmbE family N-acetylglucosaminyl deacetylase